MSIIYNISINQLAVVANGWDLDCTDMAIFQCFHIFGSSPKTLRITTLEGQWFWISAKKIIEELPILGIGSEKQIKRRIQKLIDCGLLMKCTEETTKDYYKFGQNYEKLFARDVDKNVHAVIKSSIGKTDLTGGMDKNVHDERTKMSTEDYINNNIIQEDNNIPPIIPHRGTRECPFQSGLFPLRLKKSTPIVRSAITALMAVNSATSTQARVGR